MQELLQNCDDAGARHVTFMLDKRKSCSSGSAVPASLKPFFGPALLQYDDAMFKEKDFRSLSEPGNSCKKMDPTSTGKFGLGFNSVYHITDLPCLLSGQPDDVAPVACIMDSHKRLFVNADDPKLEPMPGIKFSTDGNERQFQHL